MTTSFHRPMRRRTRDILTGTAIAAVLAVALVGCAPDGDVSVPDAVAESSAALQQAVDGAVESGIPSVFVRIDDGSSPYTLTAESDWTEPMSEEQTFRVGSNSKTATSVLLLQLVDEGELSLDDTIGTWFENVPNGDTATIRMLLNHTSGLADYAQQPQVLAAVAGQRPDVPGDDELIEVGIQATLASDPIEGFHYSNTGYAILGKIIERVAGQPIQELFADRIAEPLGLTETHFAESGDVAEARGYEPDAAGLAPLLPEGTPEGFGMAGPSATEGWVDVTDIDQSWGSAAGSIISTAGEWATFQMAVAAGELTSAESLEQMHVTVDEGDGGLPGRSYGLGLELIDAESGNAWGHDGGLPGYRSDTYTDLAGERSVTVFSSTNFGILSQPGATIAHSVLVEAAIGAMFAEVSPAK